MDGIYHRQLNRNDGQVRWLVIIDIDDFKHINDTYGHIFGDQVIRRVAEIMQELVGQRGVIGRFGGDEYVILLEKVETREQLKTSFEDHCRRNLLWL